MKKIGFIFGLHGLVFSIFMIINMIIEESVYAFLTTVTDLPWLVAIIDLILSGFLYVVIYTVIYFIYKFMVLNIKKEILNVKGKWYHVHIKHNENGCIKTDKLRAGESEVAQDLYDLKFSAINYSYALDENDEVIRIDDERKNTGWDSWAVDWDGREKITTCFKANTQVKDDNEFTNRYGIHRLVVNTIKQEISGNFADEYPSQSRGEIYFFRTEEKQKEFIKKILLELR